MFKIILALLLAAVLFIFKVHEGATEIPTAEVATSTPLEESVKQPEVISSQLKRICSCESTGSPNNEPIQFEEDGRTPLRGKIHPPDVGSCQINQSVWGDEAVKMGLDIEYSQDDNYKMAKHIMEVQGLNAWAWSYACWKE